MISDSMDEAVVVALGANLGNAAAAITAALARFPSTGLREVARSRLWRSQAWPDPHDPPYLNAVALVETTLGPEEVIAVLLALEARAGRTRAGANAPRTLDLDLIAHGRRVIEGPRLSVPHPRAAERRFVMGPLAELAPAWRHPVTGECAAELAARATIGRDAAPLEA